MRSELMLPSVCDSLPLLGVFFQSLLNFGTADVVAAAGHGSHC